RAGRGARVIVMSAEVSSGRAAWIGRVFVGAGRGTSGRGRHATGVGRRVPAAVPDPAHEPRTTEPRTGRGHRRMRASPNFRSPGGPIGRNRARPTRDPCCLDAARARLRPGTLLAMLRVVRLRLALVSVLFGCVAAPRPELAVRCE